MQSQACYKETVSEMAGDFDREELLRNVMNLRQDVVSIAAEVREVLSENEKLKQEVTRLNERRDNRKSISEVTRIKNEIDQLLQLHEAVSSRSGISSQAARRGTRERSDSTDNASWTRKMMMFMMLAEMI